MNVQTLNLVGGGTTTSIENSEELVNILKRLKGKGSTWRTANLLGMGTKDYQIDKAENIPSDNRSKFAQTKYKFFLEAPFEISSKCCNVMKKEPSHQYSKKTGKKAIVATMASESRLRTQKWLQHGCNGFDLKIPTSTPMSFWTEQDVLLYIKEHNLPICSVYGEIVVDDNQADGQMCIADYASECGLFDLGNPLLKTTGCSRTGCVLCGFGCHMEPEGEGRFELLKQTHPGLYGLLDVIQNNGVTMRQAIDWVNEHGNLNIKY